MMDTVKPQQFDLNNLTPSLSHIRAAFILSDSWQRSLPVGFTEVLLVPRMVSGADSSLNVCWTEVWIVSCTKVTSNLYKENLRKKITSFKTKHPSELKAWTVSPDWSHCICNPTSLWGLSAHTGPRPAWHKNPSSPSGHLSLSCCFCLLLHFCLF